jgi:hypothetical protein
LQAASRGETFNSEIEAIAPTAKKARMLQKAHPTTTSGLDGLSRVAM